MATIERSLTFEQGVYQTTQDFLVARLGVSQQDYLWHRSESLSSGLYVTCPKQFQRPGPGRLCGGIPLEWDWHETMQHGVPINIMDTSCGYLDKTVNCNSYIYLSVSGYGTEIGYYEYVGWFPYSCGYYGTHTEIWHKKPTADTRSYNEAQLRLTGAKWELTHKTTLKHHAWNNLIFFTYFRVLGSLEESRSIEVFNFLEEIVPLPYSIRNSPSTFIWIRLRDSSYPLNADAVVLTVNSVNVTNNTDIHRVENGVEIFYEPEEDFVYGSRVFVDLFISTSTNREFAFALPAAVGDKHIYTSGIDVNTLNPGSFLRLGPNIAGEEEVVELIDVLGAGELEVAPLIKEYNAGNKITYFRSDSNALNLSYYFDIIPDFRPPWFENIYPVNNQENVDPQGSIYFTIKDEGLGVNIGSLIFRVNEFNVTPNVKKISNNEYFITYKPIKTLYYGAYVYCYARVEDLAAARNYSSIYWRFKTQESESPLVLNVSPDCCHDHVYTMSDIYFEIYGRNSGLDLDSLLLSIDGINHTFDIFPRIYRLK